MAVGRLIGSHGSVRIFTYKDEQYDNCLEILPPSSIVRRMKEYHRYQGVELTLRRLMQRRINAAEIFLWSALMLRFAWCMAACNPSIRDCMAHAPVFNCT